MVGSNTRRSGRMSWRGMALAVLAGCTPSALPTVALDAEPVETHFLIDEVSRAHHFGAVIAQTGTQRVHRFALRNATDRPLTIVEVVNRKPCCGALALGKAELAPGEETALELTLNVGGKFGDVVHEAVIVTDPPSPDEIVLHTTARAYPPVRIEELNADFTALVKGGLPRACVYQIIAHGTPDQPAIDLNHATIGGTVKANWLDEAKPGEAVDGVTATVRKLGVSLEPVGEPGDRRDSLTLSANNESVLDHTIAWRLDTPITATPKVLVVRPGKTDYKILLRATGEDPFRVTNIEAPEIVATLPTDETAHTTQSISFHIETPPTGAGKSEVAILTDHPNQPRVTIPIVSLEQ